MNNLNNIPNAGNWGDAASKLNDNFNKIKQAVTTVENTSKNNKGYFTSLSALNTAFPSPKAGQTAYVYDEASSTNYYIYDAVNGAWVTSSIEAPSVGVAIAEYTKTGGSTKTTKDVENEIVQLAYDKANHGYDSSPKTLKQVDDDLVQLESDVSLKVRNLITNGDFVNDVNGWVGSGLSVEHDSGRLRAYNWSATQNRIASPDMEGLSIGDLLYLRIGEYERSAIPTPFPISDYIIITINSVAPNIIYEQNNPNLIIKNLSGIAAYNGAIPRIHIRTYQGADNSVWIDDVVCINLTETFGAGNEPSKEEMDLLISTLGIDYFEGEITIPAQKIMQWQQVKSLNAMFMRAGFQIKDVTSYNEYYIPNEYNCVWEDGAEGRVVLSDFDEYVFEYKRKKAYYNDIEVDYGDVIYDENGYILSQSPTLIN